MKQIYRFHDYHAAQIVLGHTKNRISGTKLYIDRIPSEDTRSDPPGDYCICAEDDVPFRSNLSSAVDDGIQLALAEALRQLNPHHPLLTIWHLRPENQSKRGKYNVSNSISS